MAYKKTPHDFGVNPLPPHEVVIPDWFVRIQKAKAAREQGRKAREYAYPKYYYQKPEYGFGSAGGKQDGIN